MKKIITFLALLLAATASFADGISGSSSLCQGTNTVLTGTPAGGVWSSSNTLIATVSSSGEAGGVSSGSVTISYTVDTVVYTTAMTIEGVIPVNGPNAYCIEGSALLTHSVPGGEWSLVIGLGTIDTTGGNCRVFADGPGTQMVSYTYTGGCGTVTAYKWIFGIIPFLSTTLIDISSPSWDTAIIRVGETHNVVRYPSVYYPWGNYSTDWWDGWSTPDVTKLSFVTYGDFAEITAHIVGMTSLTYHLGNICGSDVSYTLPVKIEPALDFSGPQCAPAIDTICICESGTANLTATAGYGLWTVNGDAISLNSSGSSDNTTAVITGLHPGVSMVTYETYVGSATHPVKVLPDHVDPISGPNPICAGSVNMYTDAVPGGVWSISDAAIATINASGTVTAITPGIVTISYSLTNSCGSSNATKTVTVLPVPAVNPPVIPASVCTGETVFIGVQPVGIIITVADGSVFHVIDAPSGMLFAGFPGTTVINLAFEGNACGGTVATTIIGTVITAPTVGSISGPDTVCVGAGVIFHDLIPGGTYSSFFEPVATAAQISVSDALITGVHTGSTPINYIITNICGSSMWSKTINVIDVPYPSVITGPISVTNGATVDITASPVNGILTSSGGVTIAQFDSTDTVVNHYHITGATVGTTTLTYSKTNSCGTNVPAYTSMAILNSLFDIYGGAALCPNTTTAYSDSTPGGIWSIGDMSIATVDGSGVVSGVSAGATTLTYTVGSDFVTAGVTVNPMPDAGTVSGATNVCVGATAGFSSTNSGGVWSAGSSNISIDTTGVVTGIDTGVAAVYYTMTNSCGADAEAALIIVMDVPNLAAITGGATLCVGATTTLSNSTPGGIWSTSNAGIAVVSGGVVSGVAAGSATITYSVTNSCGASMVYMPVAVNPLPDAGVISGPSAVCVGSAISLSASISGGVWSTSNATKAVVNTSGVVTGVGAGSATITYTVTNSCGTAFATKSITINTYSVPTVAAIGGATSVCVGVSTNLTDATAGGTWSSSNATIAVVSGTGVVSGISAGTTIITYAVSNTCATNNATKTVTVNPQPVSPVISGPTSVCVGATIVLNSTPSGTWTRVGTAGSVSTTGVVTGVTAGTVKIKNTITNSCGSRSDSATITVNPLPTAGTIAGATSVCVGISTNLTDATAGGTWSSSDATIAIVSGTGTVTGVSAGVITISYSVTNVCGTANAVKTMTVNPQPLSPVISGPTGVCVGATIALGSTPSGTWSRVGTAGSVSAAGVVTGVTAGTVKIKNTITNSCGSRVDSTIITVNPLPTAGTISGATSVCVGVSTNLTDATTGGTWSTSDATIAVVSGTGAVTGVSAGVVTISYSVTNVCGTANAVKTMTVNPQPLSPVISGPTDVCVGAAIALSSSPSGTWSRVGTAGSVSTTGIVTGVTAATVKIKNTITNSCGSRVDSTIITVNPLPTAGTISGATSVCVGVSTNLTDATTGGTWSTSDATIAVVSGTGAVTGVSAGVVTISYSVTNVCGTANAVKTMTVNPQPLSPVISGPTDVCVGAAIALSSSPSGTWSRVGTAGSVSTTGIVAGVTAGTVKIKNTITNSCGSRVDSTIITVNPLPTAGTISGATSVCVGVSTNLTNATAGGTWSTSDATIAVVSGTGTVTGVGAGAITISYSVTNVCGTANAVKTMTVNPQPLSPVISGSTSVCVGATIALGSTPSGTWSRVGTAGSVSTTGVVTGVTAGTVKIKNTITNSCGSRVDSTIITVNPLPTAGTISGATSVCEGASTNLTDATAGGTWSSSNAAVAVVSGGSVTGIAVGSATITYSVSNTWCTANALKAVSVNPLPDAGTISGSANVCVGANITLSASVSGGTWSSSGHATINAAGNVHGVSAGIANISYTVTNSCGTDIEAAAVNVNALPNAGSISGTTTVCVGNSITLATSGSGGTWSAVGSASVDAAGNVTSSVAGTSTIYYIVSNSCGTDSTMTTVTFNPLPDAGTISGSASACAGDSIVLSDSLVGGVWSSSGSASVDASGNVTSTTADTSVIYYTVSNSCGTDSAVVSVIFNGLPDTGVITGPSIVNASATISLTCSVTGGVWSSAGTLISVSTTGIVYGITVGVDTVKYSVTNSCGTSTAVKPITVNSSGFFSMCVGTTHMFTAPGPGTWGYGDGGISVDDSGLITALWGSWARVYFYPAGGGAAIPYDFGVMQDPAVSEIWVTAYGPLSVGATEIVPAIAYGCQFGTLGETWSYTYSSNNPSIASITSGGFLTAVSPGWATINYTVTNICGTGTGHGGVEVLHPLDITGGSYCDTALDTICMCQSNFQVVQSVMGTFPAEATWSSDNDGIVAVSSTGSSFATLTAWGSGIANITATDWMGHTKTRPVRVIENPLVPIPEISGDSVIHVGETTVLHSSVSDGWWRVVDPLSTIAIASASGSSISITGLEPGWYSVYYRDSNMCSYNTAMSTIEVLPLAKGTNSTPKGTVTNASSMEVFPNPTTGTLNIQWLSQLMGMAEMVITDVTGREVYKDVWEMKAISGKRTADLSGMQTGIYFVTIKSADINYTNKVIIER